MVWEDAGMGHASLALCCLAWCLVLCGRKALTTCCALLPTAMV